MSMSRRDLWKSLFVVLYFKFLLGIFFYPRATRCGRDIVTLLWFHPCVRPSVHGPCEHDRDYTVECFFVKLGRHVSHDERMNPIDFGGQRSKVKVTIEKIWE